ncbi:MAG: hypothetical protein NXI20_24340 [bacterium]|nr:hypothetical protein [bacterium]
MFDDDDDDLSSPQDSPIFKKGLEIYEVARTIVDLIPDDNSQLQITRQFILEDALNLSVKVAGAEGSDLFDLKMESATIIRKSARDLVVHLRGLEMFGFKEAHYLDLIRQEVEEYRLLFIEWIKSFDQWNYVVDRWGLFNPPGVSPFDEDQDERR